jgi:hypothetical protein
MQPHGPARSVRPAGVDNAVIAGWRFEFDGLEEDPDGAQEIFVTSSGVAGGLQVGVAVDKASILVLTASIWVVFGRVVCGDTGRHRFNDRVEVEVDEERDRVPLGSGGVDDPVHGR